MKKNFFLLGVILSIISLSLGCSNLFTDAEDFSKSSIYIMLGSGRAALSDSDFIPTVFYASVNGATPVALVQEGAAYRLEIDTTKLDEGPLSIVVYGYGEGCAKHTALTASYVGATSIIYTSNVSQYNANVKMDSLGSTFVVTDPSDRIIYHGDNFVGALDSADGTGATVYLPSSITISEDIAVNSNCTVSGGGVYRILLNGAISASFTNCTFTNNSAGKDRHQDSNGFGGSVYAYDTNTVKIANCTFRYDAGDESNASAAYGGFVVVDACDVFSVTDSSFTGAYVSHGGAIIVGGDEKQSSPTPIAATLARCSFVNNCADWKGGAIDFSDGVTATVTDCTFTGNEVTGWSENWLHSDAFIFNTAKVTFTGKSAPFTYSDNAQSEVFEISDNASLPITIH